ncbi:MAG: Holliday junction ATP-dependent DNA helicase RuvA [Coprothermobacterota bacterium]|nr:Holliday junction ATP-dependent DNA helicase RuvA [Coprothermobacterota bacterium]
MIEQIEGRVVLQGESELLLRVGPLVLRLQYLLRQGAFIAGSEVTLHTHLFFKEDLIALFAFREREELALFRHLLTVPGVGPRTGQGIVAYVGPAGLGQAIKSGNPTALLTVPGIGKKTAVKILFALRDTDLSLPKEEWREALEALLALGFDEGEARRRLAVIDLLRPGLTVEDVIKEALQG